MSEEALSVYFGIEQGSRLDIDVIGRCLVELSAAIKDCSYFLDPAIDLRIEVVRGIDGSLILDLIVRNINKFTGDKAKLKKLAIVILCLLGTDVRQWFDSKALDRIFGTDHQATDKEKREVEGDINEIEHNDVGGIHIRNFYGTLYLDPSVTGVGAARGHGNKPIIVVKRSEFKQRSTLRSAAQINNVRVRLEEMRATLIAPVLVSGTRKWRFKTSHGEFTAPVIDPDFRDKFLSGRTNIRLQAGIEMDIVVSVLENKTNGVWIPKSREIVEVRSIRPTPHQEPFDFKN